MPRREILARLALAVASAALSFLAAEWVLRVAYPIHAVVREYDERLLFRLRPGSRKIHLPQEEPGRRVRVEINSRGFRGPELAEAPSRRLVVYGDSFIQANFSPLEATFCRQLADRLGAGVEVLNAGVMGYGPDQAYLRMLGEIDELRPAAVLLALFVGNDFGDLIRNKLFRVDAAGELVRRPAKLHPDLVASLSRLRRRLLVVRLLRAGWRRLGPPPAPAADLNETLAYDRGMQIAELNDFFVSDVVTRLFEDGYDIQLAAAPEGADSRLKVLLMERLLSRFRREVERRGAVFLVVLVPPSLDLCRRYSDAVDRTLFPDYRADNLRRMAIWASRHAGVSYVDLDPPFHAASPCELYFGTGSAHWNDAGQALAAEIVAGPLALALEAAKR